jgi:hypothetical protein
LLPDGFVFSSPLYSAAITVSQKEKNTVFSSVASQIHTAMCKYGFIPTLHDKKQKFSISQRQARGPNNYRFIPKLCGRKQAASGSNAALYMFLAAPDQLVLPKDLEARFLFFPWPTTFLPSRKQIAHGVAYQSHSQTLTDRLGFPSLTYCLVNSGNTFCDVEK